MDAGGVAPLLMTFALGIPELGAALLPVDSPPPAEIPDADRHLHGWAPPAANSALRPSYFSVTAWTDQDHQGHVQNPRDFLSQFQALEAYRFGRHC